MSRWTTEQVENAQRYGVCFVCRAPLESKLTRNGEEFDPVGMPAPRPGDGNSYALWVGCPNGHSWEPGS